MREILFHAKRLDNGEWVEGFLCIKYFSDIPHSRYVIQYKPKDSTKEWRPDYMVAEVDPATIGQYTELKDKNDKRIFEGDVFQLDDEFIGVIIFKDGCFRMQTYGMCGTLTESGYDECGGGWGIVECVPIDWYYVHDMEVIGNIHDNQELLKATQ